MCIYVYRVYVGDATGLFGFLFNSHMIHGLLKCQVCLCDKFLNQLIPAETHSGLRPALFDFLYFTRTDQVTA